MQRPNHKYPPTKRVARVGCKAAATALCCSSCAACTRLSVDSSTTDIESQSTHHAPISSIAHAMVQERLSQMITEAKRLQEAAAAKRREERRRKGKRPVAASNACSSSCGGLVVVVAMEKRSVDPREDFRRSMEEMIAANRILETKDLRYLLNCYISMNSEEYRATILEVFYEVCSDMFFSCNVHVI